MTSGISRRQALATGIGLTASAALAGCSDSSGNDKPAVVTPPGDLLIGANLELTGTGSTHGKLQEQALKIAVTELNVTGIPFGDRRLHVRIEVRDNGGDPASAEEIATQFVDQHKVSAMIGGTTVETAMAMLKVAEQRKVPILCLSGGDDITLPLPQRKFVYKLAPNASDVAALLAKEIAKRHLGPVAVLASGDGHGQAGAAAMPRALATAGLTVARLVRLPQSGRAFAEAAALIAESAAPSVIVWALAPVSAAAVAALRQAGYTGTIFLDSGAGADETLDGPNAAAVEGAFIVHPAVLGGPPAMVTTPSARAARDFIFRYIQEYGRFSGFAPYAADAVNLLAVAARRGVNLEPQRLRGRLEAGAMEGIAGAYTFQPISHGGLEPDALALFVARRGAWIRL